MKSKLFAAAIILAALVLTGCQPEVDYVSYIEKYEVHKTETHELSDAEVMEWVYSGVINPQYASELEIVSREPKSTRANWSTVHYLIVTSTSPDITIHYRVGGKTESDTVRIYHIAKK